MTENPIALLLELLDSEKRAGASPEALATIRARIERYVAEEMNR